MSLHVMSTAEKLAEVERLIREKKRLTGRGNEAIAAIALDLRARLAGAPIAALFDVEQRVVAVARSKSNGAYDKAALHVLGEGVAKHWATIKQALERFGSEA